MTVARRGFKVKVIGQVVTLTLISIQGSLLSSFDGCIKSVCGGLGDAALSGLAGCLSVTCTAVCRWFNVVWTCSCQKVLSFKLV